MRRVRAVWCRYSHQVLLRPLGLSWCYRGKHLDPVVSFGDVVLSLARATGRDSGSSDPSSTSRPAPSSSSNFAQLRNRPSVTGTQFRASRTGFAGTGAAAPSVTVLAYTPRSGATSSVTVAIEHASATKGGASS